LFSPEKLIGITSAAREKAKGAKAQKINLGTRQRTTKSKGLPGAPAALPILLP